MIQKIRSTIPWSLSAVLFAVTFVLYAIFASGSVATVAIAALPVFFAGLCVCVYMVHVCDLQLSNQSSLLYKSSTEVVVSWTTQVCAFYSLLGNAMIFFADPGTLGLHIASAFGIAACAVAIVAGFVSCIRFCKQLPDRPYAILIAIFAIPIVVVAPVIVGIAK